MCEERYMPLHEIYNIDCLEGMKRIPDHIIDCVICDLPYGVLNKGNKDAKWDIQIPFEPLWKQYERICKKNAPIILFGQGMFTAKIMMSNPKIWRYNLIWDKNRTTGFLNARRMPLRSHEDICIFYKALPTYHPQMTKCDWHKRNHSRGNLEQPITNRCYGTFKKHPSIISDEKFPKSIISIPQEHSSGGFYHPVQKPTALLEYLIMTYTNEGDTVLDNCMGSGSTGVACMETLRNFIGFEIEKQYFDIARRRIYESIAYNK